MEYTYKDFKINVSISPDPQDKSFYQANGKALCLLPSNETNEPKVFKTEALTEKGAEQQIKKMIEEYIDFEWLEFERMNK